MFFFTDLEKLNTQTVSQAFGPVAGDEHHSFKVTSQFTVQADAMAYMPVMGTVLVQPVNGDFNASRLNVAIRVGRVIGNGYTSISYIIYRGIKRSSFFAANGNFLADSPTANGLVRKMWQNWRNAQNKPGTVNTPEPSLSNFGFITQGVSPVASAYHLAKLFREGNFTTLEEGVSIGTFDDQGEIGVDIILNDGVLRADLNLLEQGVNILTVPVSAHSVDDQTYQVKHERAKLLAYLDIAALYSLSAAQGIRHNGSRSQAIAGVALVHNTYLRKLYHQNTVFLDIRNEISLWLNHYNEYKATPDPTTTPLFYLGLDENDLTTTSPFDPQWPWPIYLVNPPAPARALSLVFSVSRNPDPLVYLEFAKLSKGFENRYGKQARFISLVPSVSNAILGRSNNLELALPVILNTSNNQQVNTCCIRKLMVVRRTLDSSSNNPNYGAGPIRKTYLDNLFGPIASLEGEAPQRRYAKRWMPLNRALQKPIAGAIVEPSIVYTDEHIIFQVQVVDTYSSEMLKEDGSASWADFGTAIDTTPLQESFGPDEISSDQEAATLGAERRQIVLSTPSATDLKLLPAITSSATMSLDLTRAEYDELLGILPSNFNPLLGGGVFCFFSQPIFENTLNETPPSNVVSAALYLGGVEAGTGSLYVNLDETTMPKNMRVYSLDRRHFNSLASGQTTLVLPPSPQQEYSSHNFIADIKAVEREYATSDLRLDQTVTRVRVHYYGFSSDDLSPEPAATNNDGLIKSQLERGTRRKRHLIDDFIQGGKGTIFNHNIPSSDYWEIDPDHPNALSKFVPSGGIPYLSITPIPNFPLDTDTDKYRVRQVYVSDNLPLALVKRIGRKSRLPEKEETDFFILNNMRIRNGTVVVDPGQNVVDFGHTFYTLDALFTSPDILERATTREPSLGMRDLGITDGMWLANYLGDITGTLARSYDIYYNSTLEPRKSIQNRYTLHELIEQQYDISSPLPDFAGDADAFGLYAVWTNIFSKAPTTKLSDLLAYYYSNDPSHNKEYTYKSRWKLFSLAVGFVTYNGSQYKWEPNEAQLLLQMELCYKFGYLAEAAPKSLAEFVITAGNGGGLGTLITRQILELPFLLQSRTELITNLTFVMRKFLGQVKGILQSEQANTGWNISY